MVPPAWYSPRKLPALPPSKRAALFARFKRKKGAPDSGDTSNDDGTQNGENAPEEGGAPEDTEEGAAQEDMQENADRKAPEGAQPDSEASRAPSSSEDKE